MKNYLIIFLTLFSSTTFAIDSYYLQNGTQYELSSSSWSSICLAGTAGVKDYWPHSAEYETNGYSGHFVCAKAGGSSGQWFNPSIVQCLASSPYFHSGACNEQPLNTCGSSVPGEYNIPHSSLNGNSLGGFTATYNFGGCGFTPDLNATLHSCGRYGGQSEVFCTMTFNPTGQPATPEQGLLAITQDPIANPLPDKEPAPIVQEVNETPLETFPDLPAVGDTTTTKTRTETETTAPHSTVENSTTKTIVTTSTGKTVEKIVTTTTTTHPDGSTIQTKTTTYNQDPETVETGVIEWETGTASKTSETKPSKTGTTTETTTTDPNGSSSKTTSKTGEGGDGNETSEQERKEQENKVWKSNGKTVAEIPAEGWYESQYPDGLGGIWSDKSTALQETAFIESITDTFTFTVGAGSCPSFSIPLPSLIGGGDMALPINCTVYNFVGIVMVIGSLFLARRLVFGG